MTKTTTFLLGLVLGTINTTAANYFKEQTILESCEEPLPRNQHCKLVAIPEQAT